MTGRKWLSVISLIAGAGVSAAVLLEPSAFPATRLVYAMGLVWGALAVIHIRALSE